MIFFRIIHKDSWSRGGQNGAHSVVRHSYVQEMKAVFLFGILHSLV